jgi:tRNA (mo5U34)-methyltransferase
MRREEIEAEVNRLWWYHSIPLGDGLVTPGAFHTPSLLPTIGLPDDLSGKAVLDIGAWDGFFSFECERRGAARVVATDSYAWRDRGKEGFELARRVLRSKVEDRDLDVLELTPDVVGTFDLVLFLGVLYHMKEPLIGLEHVASVTEGHLILSTAVDLVRRRRPVVAFYPGSEYGGDPTNWWGPNPAAVLGMLRAVGFRRASVFTRPFPSLPRKVLRALRHGMKVGPIAKDLRVRHAVFHAWK